MTIAKLKSQLEKLEDGSTYVALLDSGLEGLYSEINSSKAFIKTAKKILGENEAEYQDKATKIAEYDKLQAKYTLLENQYTNLEGENKTIKRDSVLSALCTKEKINKETLAVLLPSDIELTDKGVKVSEEGKEPKEVSLKEYIKNEPKLKLFQASLLAVGDTTKESNKDKQEDPVLSTETGTNTPPKGVADTALEIVANRQKDRSDRITSRFTPAK